MFEETGTIQLTIWSNSPTFLLKSLQNVIFPLFQKMKCCLIYLINWQSMEGFYVSPTPSYIPTTKVSAGLTCQQREIISSIMRLQKLGRLAAQHTTRTWTHGARTFTICKNMLRNAHIYRASFFFIQYRVLYKNSNQKEITSTTLSLELDVHTAVGVPVGFSRLQVEYWHCWRL